MFSGFGVPANDKQDNATPKLGFGLASRQNFLVHKASCLDIDSPANRLTALSLGPSPIVGVYNSPQQPSPLSDAHDNVKDQASTASRIAKSLNLTEEEAAALCGTAKAWLGFTETEGPVQDLNLVKSYALFQEKQVSSILGMQAALAALNDDQRQEISRLICNPDALQLPDNSFEILSNCPNINFLILTPQGSEVIATEAAPDCWAHLPQLLSHLPALSCIDISNCGCTDAQLEAIAQCCTQLMGIDLSFNPGITDSGIKQLLASCSQLQELDLSNCCSLTSSSLTAVASSCPALDTLFLEQREVEEECSEQFSMSCVTAASLEAIAQGCPALRVLSLAGAPLLPDTTDPSTSSSSSSSSSSSPLAAITSSCTELCSLDLTSCHTWLTQQHLQQAAAHCASLTSLTLTGGAALTDAAAHTLAAACTTLQHLSLHHCQALTDKGLSALLRSSKQLQELQLAACPLLTDGFLAALAGCAQLQQLEMDLSSSSGTSFEAVQRAAERLPLRSAHVALAAGTFKVVNGKAFISNAWNALMGFLSSQGNAMVSPMVHRAGRRV